MKSESSIIVSVVMGVYNAAPFLREAIESILNQTFADFEFIIINDGSTDNSAEIINSYTDERIVAIYQENAGHSVSLNRGLQIARGEFIARMDSDDISLPERFTMQIEFLRSNPDYVIVGTSAEIIDVDGNHIYNNIMPPEWEKIKSSAPSIPLAHPSVMFRKTPILEIGGYDEKAAYIPIEDTILWNNIVRNDVGKIGNLPDVLIKYRLTPSSLTGKTGTITKFTGDLALRAGKRGFVTDDEVKAHRELIASVTKKEKEAMYHIYIAKKFLWVNNKPKEARKHLKNAIKRKPFFLQIYFLFLLSFLPDRIVLSIYRLIKRRHL
jgi:glycosyltransferase involved in cell wall biosynthesis